MEQLPALSKVSEHKLANGLTIYLREDHATPIAAFYVFYRVGSRNEVTGRTGLSHWVEHLLFDGTPRFPKGAVHRLVAANGGYRNGFTWNDGTAFFEVLPADRIDLAIILEADRMMNALISPEEVERERTVILSERQGGENYPSNVLYEELLATSYKVHPYGHPVIGWKTDLQRITRAELWEHYQRYYHPDNAFIVAVGDFHESEVLGKIDEQFGRIPAGEPAAPVFSVEPPQEGERRVTVTRPGGAPLLYIAYHIPNATHADLAALAILDALCSGGKALGHAAVSLGRSSRLRRALVDTGRASAVGTFVTVQHDPGLFLISAHLKPGANSREIERMLLEQVEQLAENSPSEEELTSAREQCLGQLVYSAEGVSRQASHIGRAAIVNLPVELETMAEEFAIVTADDVKRVVGTYLTEANRTVAVYLPASQPCKVLIPSAPPRTPPAPRSYAYPTTARTNPISPRRFVTSQGIVVLHHHSPGAPWQLFQVSLPAGSVFDPEIPRGLPALESALRLRGTQQHDYETLSNLLDQHAIQLVGGAGEHFSTYWMKARIPDVPLGLQLLANTVLAAAYPERYLDAVKAPLLAAAVQEQTNTRVVAERLFHKLAYPPHHPYYRWSHPTPEEVSAITYTDILTYAARYRTLSGVVIAASGGLSTDETLKLLETCFATANVDGPAPPIAIPDVIEWPARRRDFHTVPEKTQSDLVIGLPGIRRTDPDYYALSLADTIFGRIGMGGRLGEEIRERRGLAYYASTSLEAGFGPGPWAARIGVAPKDVNQALEATLAEWHRFTSEGPTEQELRDAQQLLTGSLPLRLETSEGIASQLIIAERFGLSLDLIEEYTRAILATTLDDIRTALQRHFDERRVVAAIAGPA